MRVPAAARRAERLPLPGAGWLLAGAAPVLSAAAGIALLPAAGAVFVAVNVVLLRRQPADHTRLLLASAVAGFAGHALFAAGAAPSAIVPWWFTFLVVTIAAERLEMTRLMRRRPGAGAALRAALAAQFAGATLAGMAPAAAGVLHGGCGGDGADVAGHDAVAGRDLSARRSPCGVGRPPDVMRTAGLC